MKLQNVKHLIRYLLTMVTACMAWAAPICLLTDGGAISAQPRKVMNRPYIDQRPFHYGFHAGLHVQDIEFTNNGFTFIFVFESLSLI